MTRQNRVLPTGEVVADPHRGAFMGNRGILHDNAGRLGVSRWTHPHWIICVLSFKARHRQIMAPRRYTELFFLDEAVAIAAGHRPCAECRRADYRRWQDAWADAFGERPRAGDMDRHLHRDRVDRNRRQIHYRARLDDLPDGVFVEINGHPHLLWERHVVRFSMTGYETPVALRGNAEVCVLTPKASVRVLNAGYRPVVKPGIMN